MTSNRRSSDAARDSQRIRFCTTLTSTVIQRAMKKRGWKEVDEHGDWSIYWFDVRRDAPRTFHRWHVAVQGRRAFLDAGGGIRVRSPARRPTRQPLPASRRTDTQVRCADTAERTRDVEDRDLIVKNLKRAKRLLEKDGRGDELGFFPKTFTLPQDYGPFTDEFRKTGGVWIMKPCGRAQGKGIFLLDKLSQAKPAVGRSRAIETRRLGREMAQRGVGEGASRDVSRRVRGVEVHRRSLSRRRTQVRYTSLRPRALLHPSACLSPPRRILPIQSGAVQPVEGRRGSRSGREESLPVDRTASRRRRCI